MPHVSETPVVPYTSKIFPNGNRNCLELHVTCFGVCSLGLDVCLVARWMSFLGFGGFWTAVQDLPFSVD